MSRDWPICDESVLQTIPILGSRVRLHRDVVLAARAAAHLIERMAYARTLHPGDVQGYACRHARGTEEHSEHAHGIAIDIAPERNPYHRTDGRSRPKLETDLPGPVINAWKKMGFRWGGDWTTDLSQTYRTLQYRGRLNPYCRRVCDPMHFELALSPSQVRGRADYYRRVIAS